MFDSGLLKKIIWCSLLGLSIFSAFSFAEDDCWNIQGNPSIFLYFSPEDLDIARSHLLSYCCTKYPQRFNLVECKKAVAWPDSPYWYDHLIDVGIRKLYARPSELYPTMEPDEDWDAWYKFISDTEQVKNPEVVFQWYQKYWTIKNGAPIVDTDYNRQKSLELLKTAFESESLSLYDKYNNLCFVAMMMYYNWLGSSNNKEDIVDKYYNTCQVLVRNKIKEETSFALSISQYNATTMLIEWISSYTKQFVQHRLMKLFDKFVAIYSLFNTLAKQAPLSTTCTK